jgi:hypothetical protein
MEQPLQVTGEPGPGDVAAVVVSVPFVDYVHLGRLDGAWRIVNVLWSPR